MIHFSLFLSGSFLDLEAHVIIPKLWCPSIWIHVFRAPASDTSSLWICYKSKEPELPSDEQAEESSSALLHKTHAFMN